MQLSWYSGRGVWVNIEGPDQGVCSEYALFAILPVTLWYITLCSNQFFHILMHHVYPKYSDRWAQANSADSDQTAQGAVWSGLRFFSFYHNVSDTQLGSQIELFKFSEEPDSQQNYSLSVYVLIICSGHWSCKRTAKALIILCWWAGWYGRSVSIYALKAQFHMARPNYI